MTMATLTPEQNKQCAILRHFIPKQELATLVRNLRSEEGEFFVTLLCSWAEKIGAMPKTYEQDGKGMDSMAHLHYFRGRADWYITEKDMTGNGTQQAFGWADLGFGGELGYISIAELIANGVELDLYWKAKSLQECKNVCDFAH
jgi:hypothetical protein